MQLLGGARGKLPITWLPCPAAALVQQWRQQATAPLPPQLCPLDSEGTPAELALGAGWAPAWLAGLPPGASR